MSRVRRRRCRLPRDGSRVYAVELDASYEPLGALADMAAEYRSRHHEAHAWTLPPRANLERNDDLLVLEPVSASEII